LNFELIGHLLIDITVSVLRLVKGGQYLAEVEAEISDFEDAIRNLTIEL
jgi:hypothetical protein